MHDQSRESVIQGLWFVAVYHFFLSFVLYINKAVKFPFMNCFTFVRSGTFIDRCVVLVLPIVEECIVKFHEYCRKINFCGV